MKIAISAIALIVAFLSGTLYHQITVSPEIKYIEIPTTNYITQYIEKEIIKEKPVALKDFTSLQELQSWLAKDYTDGVHLICPPSGSINLTTDVSTYKDPRYNKCDDYAYELQQAAMRDGYLISIELDEINNHALNLVFIGNDIYFIEPQTDKIWLECSRD